MICFIYRQIFLVDPTPLGKISTNLHNKAFIAPLQRRRLGLLSWQLKIYILRSLSYCARNRKLSIIQYLEDVFKTNQKY
jgi:hypothetical protein